MEKEIKYLNGKGYISQYIKPTAYRQVCSRCGEPVFKGSRIIKIIAYAHVFTVIRYSYNYFHPVCFVIGLLYGILTIKELEEGQLKYIMNHLE